MFEVIVVALLIIITGLLLHINSKLPARDRVQEAMERDRDRRHSQNQSRDR
ncbi:hypothetical protein ABIE27_003876 [Paenibacillus sp. 4624]|uniref:hypothetical protein n=1 Tax=Paenibacillus TaxID=44249 RepID=UPI0018644526|nr:hypothetical protein [Paenibacillus amylolyticus]